MTMNSEYTRKRILTDLKPLAVVNMFLYKGVIIYDCVILYDKNKSELSSVPLSEFPYEPACVPFVGGLVSVSKLSEFCSSDIDIDDARRYSSSNTEDKKAEDLKIFVYDSFRYNDKKIDVSGERQMILNLQ